jgi:hypothetical protein
MQSTDPRIIPIYRDSPPLDLPPRSTLWTVGWLVTGMLAILAFGLLVLPLFALGQTPALPDTSSGEAILTALLAALSAGDWRYVAVLAVIALTYVVRRYGPSLPWVGQYLVSSRAGAITALVLALVTGLAPPILGWAPWSVRLVLDVLLAGLAAIGGWVGARRILGLPAPDPVQPAA